MGLTGPSGVLPVRYTELLIDRARYRDTAMWSFLDIYTHRAVSLFYRAWEKYRFPVQYERGNDAFTEYLFDFVGLGTNGLKNRQAVEDETLLPYAGLLAQKPHSSVSLEQMIADYFEIDAQVEQFFGQWIELDDESITRIGTANSKLGYTAIAGTRIWDQQSKFRLRLGALPFQKFQAFPAERFGKRAAQINCQTDDRTGTRFRCPTRSRSKTSSELYFDDASLAPTDARLEFVAQNRSV